MLLLIKSPLMHLPERQYIYEVILKHFLGLPYTVIYEERSDIVITQAGIDRSSFKVADVLLQTEEENWLRIESMPQLPLKRFEHPLLGNVPVLYGKPNVDGGYFNYHAEGIECGIDLFGSAFFMLTRYEECICNERDARDRFPSTSSLAHKMNFLHRPIVNEYLEILWESVERLWPSSCRMRRQENSIISHDVDWPFYTFGKSGLRMAKDVLADAMKRRDFQSAYKKGMAIWRTRNGDYTADPFNTFRWLMDQSEQTGIRSAFYFITEETVAGMDGNYSIYDPEIQSLLREIHERGHEIGLHPSYDTYTKPERIKHQFEVLQEVAESNGIYQQEWGGRQHYLRWRAPDTWQHWEDAGLNYDSTLSYADAPGFRCGVCYEYPVFNLKSRKMLKLKERPLIIMEQTVTQSGLDKHQALETIRNLQGECRKYGGSFTLLWHNSEFVRKEQQALYHQCLSL